MPETCLGCVRQITVRRYLHAIPRHGYPWFVWSCSAPNTTVLNAFRDLIAEPHPRTGMLTILQLDLKQLLQARGLWTNMA